MSHVCTQMHLGMECDDAESWSTMNLIHQVSIDCLQACHLSRQPQWRRVHKKKEQMAHAHPWLGVFKRLFSLVYANSQQVHWGKRHVGAERWLPWYALFSHCIHYLASGHYPYLLLVIIAAYSNLTFVHWKLPLEFSLNADQNSFTSDLDSPEGFLQLIGVASFLMLASHFFHQHF